MASTPAQQYLISKLMGYSFMIEYRTGKSNRATDVLSRREEEVEIQIVLFCNGLIGIKLMLKFSRTVSYERSFKTCRQGLSNISITPLFMEGDITKEG